MDQFLTGPAAIIYFGTGIDGMKVLATVDISFALLGQAPFVAGENGVINSPGRSISFATSDS